MLPGAQSSMPSAIKLPELQSHKRDFTGINKNLVLLPQAMDLELLRIEDEPGLPTAVHWGFAPTHTPPAPGSAEQSWQPLCSYSPVTFLSFLSARTLEPDAFLAAAVSAESPSATQTHPVVPVS